MYTFSQEQIEIALKANGWHQLWADDNWVHKDDKNPDYSGVDLITAFKVLLREANLR